MNPTAATNQTGASLTPFNRNEYFYGKLMMVRDFLAEQVYMNGKRHLINHLVNGWGIVCGLGVQSGTAPNPSGMGTDAVLTVQPGVALDCCGREIVVDQVATYHLLPNQAAGTYNLCLAYSECLQDPVSALANASNCEERCEYNRIRETYKLSLQPAPQVTSPPQTPPEIAFWTSTKQIYQDSNLTITRQAPQTVNPGQLFYITLEATLQSGAAPTYPEVDITENFSPGITVVQGLSPMNVATFKGPGSQVYWVQVSAGTSSPIQVSASTSKGPLADSTSNINVIAGPVSDQLVAAYFSNVLAQCPTCASTDCVVLATVTLDYRGNISVTPSTQFVYDNLLLFYLISALSQQVSQSPSLQTLSVSQDGNPVQSGVTDLNFKSSGVVAARGTGGSATIDLAKDLTVNSLTWGNQSRLSADGTVGVGTTKPQAMLHVTGGGQFGPFAVSPSGQGRLMVSGQDGAVGFADQELRDTPPTTQAGDRFLWYNRQHVARLFTDGKGDLVTVDSTGNVGIGTPSPNHPLDVVKSATPGDTASAQQVRIGIDPNPNNGLSIGYFQSNTGQPNAGVLQARQAGTGVYLCLNPNGGSVGIGTLSPNRPLVVQSHLEDLPQQLIGFNDPNGTTKWHINQNVGATPANPNPNPGLNFAETGVADGRLFLKAGGNIGIGTVNPANKLEVVSSGKQGSGISITSAGRAAMSITGAKGRALAFSVDQDGEDKGVIEYSNGAKAIVIDSNESPNSVEIWSRNREILSVAGYDVTINGHLTVRGRKSGYLTEYFVNRCEQQQLEQGDVIVIARRRDEDEIKELRDFRQRCDIPIAEVDVTDQAGDQRVCGIVLSRVKEDDLPCIEESEDGEKEATPKPHLLLSFAASEKEGDEHIGNQKLGRMATVGAVAQCKVDADKAGSIQQGDLLTTSTERGYAQKATDPPKVGTILGKALAPLESGKGTIPVLVSLQ